MVGDEARLIHLFLHSLLAFSHLFAVILPSFLIEFISCLLNLDTSFHPHSSLLLRILLLYLPVGFFPKLKLAIPFIHLGLTF